MSLSAWLFDLQSAWRGLRSGRWASVTAVVALAVGLGASVSATMVAYASLVRPPPFSRATELVTLGKTYAIFAIGLGGCYLPGRRAASADPALLLRSE